MTIIIQTIVVVKMKMIIFKDIRVPQTIVIVINVEDLKNVAEVRAVA